MVGMPEAAEITAQSGCMGVSVWVDGGVVLWCMSVVVLFCSCIALPYL